MIRLENVGKAYEARVALAPTTLEVARGASLALVGPSGCGKSTLLRVLVGLVTPDTGQVTVAGERLSPGSMANVRAKTGYVLQDGGLFPHLTCAANVALVARARGWADARIAARLRELAALVRLPHEALGRFPARVSGGQRQRVALMRALMLDPEVLLLDEPLGALDPVVRIELQDELKRIFETLDKTVILVTHDLAEAAFLGREIALMRAGAVVQRGAYRDLVERPADAFVTTFVRATRPLPGAPVTP